MLTLVGVIALFLFAVICVSLTVYLSVTGIVATAILILAIVITVAVCASACVLAYIFFSRGKKILR